MGLISYYIQHSHSPAVWKSVMGLAANHAAMAAPMQAITEISARAARGRFRGIYGAAQRRLYRLKPEPLREVDAWLAQFRRFWSAHLDALERHLNRIYPLTKTKISKATRPKPRK